MTTAIFQGQLTPASAPAASSSSGAAVVPAAPNYAIYRTNVTAADGADVSAPATGAARRTSSSARGLTFVQLRFRSGDVNDQAGIEINFYTSASSGFVSGRSLTVQPAQAALDADGYALAAPIQIPTQAGYADVRLTQAAASGVDVYLWSL